MSREGYKHIVFDVNGTVTGLRPDAPPSPAVIDRFRTAANQGIDAIAVTGLPGRFAEPTFRALGVRKYCLTNGGAEWYSPGLGLVVTHERLNVDKQPAIAKVFAQCDERGIPVYSSEGQYGNGPPVASVDDLDRDNTKLVIENIEPDESDQLVNKFRKLQKLAVYRSPSWKDDRNSDIHVTAATATKANVLGIINHYKWRPEDVVIVGDSELDLPMLTIEGIGLAAVMYNAPKKLKKRIEKMDGIVIPSVEEDGVAWLLDEYVLGKDPAQEETAERSVVYLPSI